MEHQYCKIGNEESYCTALPMKCNNCSKANEKLDEVLKLVRQIDSRTKGKPPLPLPNERPSLPTKPKPKRNNVNTLPVIPIKPFPPPIPAKPLEISTGSSTAKTFSKENCEYFCLQLKSVREFLDAKLDDEFEEKRDNIVILNSIIEAFTVRSHN